jgi:chromosome condensin MukBEF MukE localization factor
MKDTLYIQEITATASYSNACRGAVYLFPLANSPSFFRLAPIFVPDKVEKFFPKGKKNAPATANFQIFFSVRRVGNDVSRAGIDVFRAGIDVFRAGNDVFRAGNDVFRAGIDVFRAGNDVSRAGNDVFRAGNDVFPEEMDDSQVEFDLLKIDIKSSILIS